MDRNKINEIFKEMMEDVKYIKLKSYFKQKKQCCQNIKSSVKLLKKVVCFMFRVFYIFIIYAIIGWFMEVAIVSVKKEK